MAGVDKKTSEESDYSAIQNADIFRASQSLGAGLYASVKVSFLSLKNWILAFVNPLIPTTLPPSGSAGGDLSGSYPNPTVKQTSVAFAINGIISISLGSNTNNWNPTGLSGANTIRLNATAAIDITGLVGGAAGRVIILHNVNATFTATLKNNSGSSSSGNKFGFQSGDILVPPNGVVILQFDNTNTIWRCVGTSSSSNIYNSNGTLLADRVVTLGSNKFDISQAGGSLFGIDPTAHIQRLGALAGESNFKSDSSATPKTSMGDTENVGSGDVFEITHGTQTHNFKSTTREPVIQVQGVGNGIIQRFSLVNVDLTIVQDIILVPVRAGKRFVCVPAWYDTGSNHTVPLGHIESREIGNTFTQDAIVGLSAPGGPVDPSDAQNIASGVTKALYFWNGTGKLYSIKVTGDPIYFSVSQAAMLSGNLKVNVTLYGYYEDNY